MPEAYRRIIRKPADVAEKDWSRLGEALATAIEQQSRLAGQCRHVLALRGRVATDDDGNYLIEHEPAVPFPTARLFDREAPPATNAQLIRVTAALYEALKTAQQQDSPNGAHGGINPGILLVANDGTVKVADFGIAPAVCSALGADAYMNLAVDTVRCVTTGDGATAAWEVLSPDEFTRDDRICGFVDPEKYGTHTLASFEPGSDIIAAAFVAHMLAEHKHPYLGDEPEAHRLVDMSEFMAMGRYNGARRKDLRESQEPGIRIWCDFIAKALARLPQDRPTAAQIADALAEHVSPPDPAEQILQRLDALEPFVLQGAWTRVRDVAKEIAEHAATPPEAATRARSLLDRADAESKLSEAEALLESPDWIKAQALLESVKPETIANATTAERASTIKARVVAAITADRTLDEIEAATSTINRADPVAALDALQSQSDRLIEISSERHLSPPLAERLESIRLHIVEQLQEVRAAAEESLAEDRRQAQQWLDALHNAIEDDDLDSAENLHSGQPDAAHWSKDQIARADELQDRFRAKLAQRKRHAAMETDHAAARAWLDQVANALAADDVDTAESTLAQRPRLTHWPTDGAAEIDRLIADAAGARRRLNDARQATEWCKSLQVAVDKQDWQTAGDLLAARPSLEYWPKDAEKTAAALEKHVGEHVDAAELDLRRQEHTARVARQWLDRANVAGNAEEWEKVLDILDDPPPVDPLPAEIQEQAEALRRSCVAALGARSMEQLRRRSRDVEALARQLLDEVAAKHFTGLIDPETIDLSIDQEEFVSEQPGADGRARMNVLVHAPGLSDELCTTHCPFDFCIGEAPQKICDEVDATHGHLKKNLAALLVTIQQCRLQSLEQIASSGVFAAAKLSAAITEPAPRLTAQVRLPGPQDAAGSFPVDLLWDAAEMNWVHKDPAGLVRRALRSAGDVVAAHIVTKLQGASAELKRNWAILDLAVDAAPPADPKTPPETLEIDVNLSVRSKGAVQGRKLLSATVKCSDLNNVSVELDTAAATVTLSALIAAAQKADAANVEADLKQHVQHIGAKARIESLTAIGGSPVESIRFRIAAGKLEPVEVETKWDPKTAAFLLRDDWKADLEERLKKTGGGLPIPPWLKTKRGKLIAAGALAGVVVIVTALAMRPKDKNGTVVIASPTPTPTLRPTPAPTQPPTPSPSSVPTIAGTPTPEPTVEPTTTPASTPPTTPTVTPTVTPTPTPQPTPTATPQVDAFAAAHQQRITEFNAFKDRLNALQSKVEKPEHDQIAALIDQGDVTKLVGDLDTFAEALPADKEAELAALVKSDLDRLKDLQTKLDAYAKVIDMKGVPIAERIPLLEDAGKAFPTKFVNDLLAVLPSIQARVDTAGQLLQNNNWRAATFIQQALAKEAAEKSLPPEAAAMIAELDESIVANRRETLAPLLEDARGWLEIAQPPADVNELLRLSQPDAAPGDLTRPATMRNKLDELDLNFPTGVKPADGQHIAEAVTQAAVEQKLFPWTLLTDEQRHTVTDMLKWVTFSLPLESQGGAAAIDFTFIPMAESMQVLDPIWMSQTEVTVAQYKAVIGELPKRQDGADDNELRVDPQNPVAYVTAQQAKEFCTSLSERHTGRLFVRVPKCDERADRGEWYFAATAGRFSFHDAHPQLCTYQETGEPKLDKHLYNCESDEFEELTLMKPGHEDGFGRYAPVRSYASSRWLLYDMIGNVSEWAEQGGKLATVGGSFRDPSTMNFAEPIGRDPALPNDDVGMRIVILPATAP